MAPPKSRLVVRVERDDSASDGHNLRIVVRDGDPKNGIPYGEPYGIAWSNLRGQEHMRVGANVGIVQPHGTTDEERLRQVKLRVMSEGYVPNEFVPRKGVTPRPEPISVPIPVDLPTDEIDFAPIPVESVSDAANAQDGNPFGKLGEALAELIPPSIDVEAVKAEIIADALAAVESKLQTVETVTIVISDPLTGLENELPKLHHPELPKAIQAVAAGVNVMLTGPAGSGKTMIAQGVASALNKTFFADSFTDDMMRSSLFGFINVDGYQISELRRAIDSANDQENTFGSLYLADELDNGRTSIQSGLNMVMSNDRATFPDMSVVIPPRPMFSGMIACNTWGNGQTTEYMGRFAIDHATKTRFPFKMFIDYALDMERQAALANSTESARSEVNAWIDYAQSFRVRANDARVKVILSPREIIAGARLLSAGMKMQTVKEHIIFAELPAAIIEKIGV